MEYTGAGDGALLMMLVLHDDAEREYAYGPAKGLPDTKVGTLEAHLPVRAVGRPAARDVSVRSAVPG